ncbi:MAG: radical SAM protein [Clostridia bacterium]|nr:radical SAM protein [Clostridia bacterium]
MRYEGNIYRPPSEARSLIIQVTVGCSHNKCTFCSMFKDKKFHIRPFEDIEKDLIEIGNIYPGVKKIFLADGDALCLSNSKLLRILDSVRKNFPQCQRVGVYGSAKDILHKTPAELKDLHDAGIGIVYIGAESGSQKVLDRVCKSASRQEIIDGTRMAEEAGIAASVSFISGLGGQEMWQEHAVDSATMVSAMNPSYASFLTLMVSPQAPIYDEIQSGSFKLLTPAQVLGEMELFLENLDIKGPCVFRSNHASNYLVLAGDLPQDIPMMLDQVHEAQQDESLLRPEFWRAL